MYVSMNPKGETGKVIHVSQDDTNREVEFIPYDQNGLVKTTSDQTVAHINSIKGNTVSFNQLVKTSTRPNQTSNGITFTNNSDGSWNANNTATANATATLFENGVDGDFIDIPSGHKIYIKKGNNIDGCRIMYAFWNGSGTLIVDSGTPATAIGQLYTATDNIKHIYLALRVNSGTSLSNVKFYPMIFDLTLMGIDNLTTTAEVEAYIISHLGNLDYFGFTLGTLIPFMGTGLKTENADQTESNTLSLPTLTYFPTGMKSAGTVYDELTGVKAITRIGSVDLGSLDYESAPTSGDEYRILSLTTITGIKIPSQSSVVANIICSRYATISNDNSYLRNVGIAITTTGKVAVYDNSYNTSSSVSAFKTAMSGQYLYYEKATPSSQDISLDLTYPIWNGGTEQILPINDSTPDTAPIKANITYPDRTEDTEFLYKQTSFEWIYKSWAFVCKNITQALSVVGNALKGTIPGTMTSESGKFPLKVKMTDNDGVCFGEKVDLFVERKP